MIGLELIINVDVLEARLEFYNVVGMDIVNTNICEQLDADFGEEVLKILVGMVLEMKSLEICLHILNIPLVSMF